MTVREIANELTKRGYKVEYRPRSDGGILITKINGVSYRGAAGNKFARTIIGDEAQLSASRKTQLKIIKPKKGPRAKKDLLSESMKSKIEAVQKIYNKNKVPISQGRITRRLIRKIIQEEGEKSAIKKLGQAARYATGYAVSKVVEALVDEVNRVADLLDSQALYDLADEIKAHDGSILDEWIKPAYDELYELNKGKDIRDVITNVKRILHI